MTPEQQAQQIRKLFRPYTNDWGDVEGYVTDASKIAVQLIINANPHSKPVALDVTTSTMQYWMDVLKVLNK